MKKNFRRWVGIVAAVSIFLSSAVVCSAEPVNSSGSATSKGTTTATGTAAADKSQPAAKKIKVKKQTFTLQTAKLKKKAAAVKVGTSDLTLKKDEGYLCFVAPKTRVYSFRISSFLTKKKGTASVMFQAPDAEDPFFSYLIGITKGTTKKEALEFKTQKTSAEKRKAVLAGKTFSGKTVRMKLKKKQVLYIYIETSYPKATARLQIS